MFAPKLRVKGADGREVSIQQFLQGAFLNMWELVVKTVADLEAVIGFEVRKRPFVYCSFLIVAQMMNEPHRGYIELQSMHAFDYNTDLHLGHVRK